MRGNHLPVAQSSRNIDGLEAAIRCPLAITQAPVDHAQRLQRLAGAGLVCNLGRKLQLALEDGERLRVIAAKPVALAQGPERADNPAPFARRPESRLCPRQPFQCCIIVAQQVQHTGQRGLGLRHQAAQPGSLRWRGLPGASRGSHPKPRHAPDLSEGQHDFAAFAGGQAGAELVLQQVRVQADGLAMRERRCAAAPARR